MIKYSSEIVPNISYHLASGARGVPFHQPGKRDMLPRVEELLAKPLLTALHFVPGRGEGYLNMLLMFFWFFF